MRYMNYAALREPYAVDELHNPLRLTDMVGGHPHINFFWKEVSGKRRLIGNPNRPMRILHKLFGQYITGGISAMGKDDYPLRRLPSSTGFVKGSNPLKNAQKHIAGKFFYIADIRNAYPSINLEKLSALIVYIKKYEEHKLDFSLSMLGQDDAVVNELRDDRLFPTVQTFLESFCSGMHGEGLAIGGPLSPFLFNLYCEVFVDAGLRKLCEKNDITFTRYADDLVF